MLDASSTGRALPKTKSIHVEANILDEWLSEKQRVVELVTKRALMLSAVVAIGFLAIPPLHKMGAMAAAEDKKAQKSLAALNKELNSAKEQLELVKPQMDLANMRSESQRKVDALTGHLFQLFNAVPSGVAISTLKCEMMGGELTFSVKADALDPSGGMSFTEEASKGPGTVSAIQTATRKSSVMSDSGVSFDFVKRVKVSL